MKKNAPLQEFYTIEETASLLRMARNTLYNRICKSARTPFPIKPIRGLNGRPIFRRVDIDNFIAKLQTEPEQSQAA